MRNSAILKNIDAGCSYYVSALAGTGKTTLLVDIANKMKNEKILYLAFNEKIVKESVGKFPSNVTCKTIHSIAYSRFGQKYKNKLRTTISLNLVINALFIKKRKDKYQIAKKVLEKINNFLYSEFLNIEDSFSFNDSKALKVYVREIYNKMLDHTNSFPITHDFYLKVFQKESMLQDFLFNYDVILFDEAQDANNTIKNIIFSQKDFFKKSVIIVGDPNQYIYGFRGSVNVFDSIDDKGLIKIELNKTFRFGDEIAKVANKVLLINGSNQFFKSNPNLKSSINDFDYNSQYTIINRTNSALMGNLIDLVNKGKKVYVYGGVVLNFNLIMDVINLKENPRSVLNPFIKKFGNFKNFKNFSKLEGEKEYAIICNIVERYESDIRGMLLKVKKNTVDKMEDADVVLGTVHSVKGAEFNQVIIGNDFYSPFDNRLNIKQNIDKEEMNILYTAITRAKCNLKLNKIGCLINKYIQDEKNK